MTTTFVLDSSVLLSAGKKALYSFGENDVVIPFTVVKEIESKRSDPETGYPARSVLRALDEMNDAGDLKVGVPLGEGFGTLRVEANHIGETPDLLRSYPSNDTRIATVAFNLKLDDPNVVLVTKDLTLRIVASLVDVPTQGFGVGDFSTEHIDKVETAWIDSEVIDQIHGTGGARLNLDVPLNVPLELRSFTEPKKTALVLAQKEYIFRKVEAPKISGLESHSREQAFAIDYLTDEDVQIVSLGGRAGTGKTTLALAAGVEQLDKPFKKIIVFRSMHSVGGEELGFLPGTEQEKLDPWTKAIFDSLESFLTKGQIDKLKREQRIEVLPITHVRGRTFSNAFIVIDEAQNLERATIMTLLSRLGHNSKAVLSWDVSQRDNFRVGRFDGIYEVVRRLLGEELFGHVSLHKSERSAVAELVSRKLDDFDN
jgi:PhoH-like ATPase